MKTSDFNYNLPPECIAQTPMEPRDHSRLLVLDRNQDTLKDAIFRDLGQYLKPEDLLVINQTRVIPARLFARKPTSGKVELLLLKRLEPDLWEALVGGKRVLPGMTVKVEEGPEAQILEDLGGSRRKIRFLAPLEHLLPSVGQMPLPPYIHTHLENPERYQTVYSKESGSAAAPTAGLHFTPRLMEQLEAQGIRFVRVTLHVGLDTFAPVTEDDPQTHTIHTEWCEVTPAAAAQINAARQKGGRIIAVGTTSVRTLETAARQALPGDAVGACSGATGLYILPGFEFKAVDALVTNFHLPRSTLLMLVSAFASRDQILSVYREAVRREYRFYSFGDAMLIL